ncbi:MAG: pyruvoyl-dependent arginine decarboxylase, partial [Haloarculaceae archaeon]
MSVIRVVWGSGTGPTGTAAYDAALAEAGVHDYNLVTVSSV